MKHESVIDELHAYCEEVGLKASTVCVRALNDSRYVSRHERRLDALERDAQRLRQYMKDNPPAPKSEEAA